MRSQTAREAGALGRRDIKACVALLTPVLLAGCVGPIQLLQRPITVESLEGDYRLEERLDRKDGRLRIADASDQDRVRIDFDLGSAHIGISRS